MAGNCLILNPTEFQQQQVLKSKARSAHANYVLRLEAEKKAQAQGKKDQENLEAEKKDWETNKKKSLKRKMISLAKVPNLH